MAARKTKNFQPPKWEPEVISEDKVFDLVPKKHLLNKINRLVSWNALVMIVLGVYHDRRGRPITNYPIRMLKAIFLQAHLGLSDEDTREAIHYSILFRKFCGFGLREKIFEKTALSTFRIKLMEAELYKPILFEINRQLKEKGLIKKHGTVFIDSTMVTANICPLTLTQFLQESLRVILHRLETKVPRVHQALIDEYGDHFDYILGKREPTIAFIDAASRTKSLVTLVGDSFELLCFLEDHDLPDGLEGKVSALKHTLEQNIVIEDRQPKKDEKIQVQVQKVIKEQETEASETQEPTETDPVSDTPEPTETDAPEQERPSKKKKGFQIKDTEIGIQIKPNGKITGRRQASPHDPDATWGRGSKGKPIPGYRPEVAVNKERYVLNVVVRTACESEGLAPNLEEMISEIEDECGIYPETACGDMAYGGQETIHGLAERGVTMVAKPGLTNVDLEGDIFDVNRERFTCRCLAGRETTLRSNRDGDRLVGSFSIKGCINCPYWHYCGGDVKVRVRKVVFPMSYAAASLIEEMHDMDSSYWDMLKERSYTVEPTIGEFKQVSGMRRTRYRGRKKVDFQWHMRGCWINLRRGVMNLAKKQQ